MNIKTFCRCCLFPSWSGYGLISTPVLDKELTSIRMGQDSDNVALFAYADYVTVVTPTGVIKKVQNVIRTYEWETGGFWKRQNRKCCQSVSGISQQTSWAFYKSLK